MEKIIPNGTKVLIYKYIREWGPNQDDENYIVGTIQSSKTSDDLSTHGSPYYVQIYEVLGTDGKKYIGTYGTGLIGNSFFRTIQDHINFLKRKISRNNESILELQEKNNEYKNQISLLVGTNIEDQHFDVLAVPCSRAFVVSADKAEEFKNQTTSPKDSAFVRDLAEKFRVNNLVEEGPVLKKNRKPNR